MTDTAAPAARMRDAAESLPGPDDAAFPNARVLLGDTRHRASGLGPGRSAPYPYEHG